MSKSMEILGIVQDHNGTKAGEIAELVDMNIDSVSGILSRFKGQQRVRNIDAKWYFISNVDRVLNKLRDIEALGTSWAEGYVSALVDNQIITETEFDTLIEEIVKKQ